MDNVCEWCERPLNEGNSDNVYECNEPGELACEISHRFTEALKLLAKWRGLNDKISPFDFENLKKETDTLIKDNARS